MSIEKALKKIHDQHRSHVRDSLINKKETHKAINQWQQLRDAIAHSDTRDRMQVPSPQDTKATLDEIRRSAPHPHQLPI